MQFVYPAFLWALAALSIPLIIHLFNFRRHKTVYFSNVRFLKEIEQQTTSYNRLKHLLVLAARLLAVTFLVLAFAQPYLPGQKNTAAAGKKAVSVFIDNSFSMNATGSGMRLLDRAKLTAKEIVTSYGSADLFQLLTHDFEGKQQRLVSRDEFLSMLQEVEPSPASRSWKDIHQRMLATLRQSGEQHKSVYLLSDFQQQMGNFEPDSTVNYYLIPLGADEAANLYIDSVWFAEPVQLLQRNATLFVNVCNGGNASAADVRLSFKLNGQTKSLNELTVEPGACRTDTLPFTVQQDGWNKAELTISDQPIVFDDNFFLSFYAYQKINILSIHGGAPNRYLEALFKDRPEFNYTSLSEQQFQPEQLTNTHLLILDHLRAMPSSVISAATRFCTEGGSVALFPALKADVESYNRLLNSMRANSITGFAEERQEVTTIQLQDNVFSDVFERVPQNISLPAASKYYTFTASTATTESPLLVLRQGGSLLSKYRNGEGTFYVCAAPLDKECTDLPTHALFVPLLYKMSSAALVAPSVSTFAGAGRRVEVTTPSGNKETVFKISGHGTEFIPEQYHSGKKALLSIGDQIRKAGFYTVTDQSGGEPQTIAINYNRRESLMRFDDANRLRTLYPGSNIHIAQSAGASAAGVVSELQRGTSLWKWCIVIALLFLAAEILLLRFWDKLPSLITIRSTP
ncbi:MAG: BatA domain-containing protein [Chitinophagales bacterium]|nr:BatA domain-containing protein [Chitinophagales bacterium]MDW8418853.1 BatA domain-containing protein [Chitinophagales bacterium]